MSTLAAVDAIPVFYDARMLADSGSCLSPSAAKPKPVVEAWQGEQLPIEVRPVVPATVEDLCLAHDPAFVRGVLSCELANGFGNTDAGVARSLPFTSGAMICAASTALSSGVACAPVSGFHHSGWASASGYCTFNGLMVAARRLLDQGAVERVLILDADMHYGDGTGDIIKRLKVAVQVENASLGRWYRTPAQAGPYLEHLARIVARFGEFDLVLYQAGADVHVDDPLGGVLTTEQMRERDRLVFTGARAGGIPIAWNLAGGYQEPLSKVVELHVNTMMECADAYDARRLDRRDPDTAQARA